MALGKLWNAFFGKQVAAETHPDSNAPQARSAASRAGEAASSERSLRIAEAGEAQPPIAPKVKRKSLGKRDKKMVPVAQREVPAVVEAPPRPSIRIAQPQRNAWTKLLAGRQIGSILDTNPGDASRAVEVLQGIVCDAVPTPKYIAIDLFELGSGGLTVVDFHQRIRRVGGQPIAIPAALTAGLRQLSQTLGTVDLVLLDGSEIDLAQLETRRLLGRVTHRDSLVLQRDARGKWQRVDALGTTTRQGTESKSRAA